MVIEFRFTLFDQLLAKPADLYRISRRGIVKGLSEVNYPQFGNRLVCQDSKIECAGQHRLRIKRNHSRERAALQLAAFGATVQRNR